MSIIKQPINKNFLSQVGFQFNIKKLPAVNFFIQSVNLPGIEMGNPSQDTPFINIPIPGDHIKYNDLTVTFKVDEDMSNYIQMSDWIIGLGFPDSFDQYRILKERSQASGEGILSDASLIITTSARNPSIEVQFIDIFPRSLTDLIFTTTDTTLEYLSATATFKYRRHVIKRLQ
jgi:hypothetical protein